MTAHFHGLVQALQLIVVGFNYGTTRKKTTDLSQVTNKLDHIVLYTSPWSGFELKTLVVICTNCTGSCKSNFHTITAITAPELFWLYPKCSGQRFLSVLINRNNCHIIVESGAKPPVPNPTSVSVNILQISMAFLLMSTERNLWPEHFG
jgi:hypothetical protein